MHRSQPGVQGGVRCRDRGGGLGDRKGDSKTEEEEEWKISRRKSRSLCSFAYALVLFSVKEFRAQRLPMSSSGKLGESVG